jgi:hypothetical protein
MSTILLNFRPFRDTLVREDDGVDRPYTNLYKWCGDYTKTYN